MKILQQNRRLHVQSRNSFQTMTGNAKALKKKKDKKKKKKTIDFAVKKKKIDLYDQRNCKQSQ